MRYVATHNGNTRPAWTRWYQSNRSGWSYHCFNCSYTASFILGRTVSFKARRLLGWMGVPENEIDMLNLESLRHRSIHGILEDRQRVFNTLSAIEFEDSDDFPPFSEVVTPEVPYYWNYIRRTWCARRLSHNDFYQELMVFIGLDRLCWFHSHTTTG
jgi:hypothetical protein